MATAAGTPCLVPLAIAGCGVAADTVGNATAGAMEDTLTQGKAVAMKKYPDSGEMPDPHAGSEPGSPVAAASLRTGPCASAFANRSLHQPHPF
jgi:hypothetical protein